jgi:hypothetical protein
MARPREQRFRTAVVAQRLRQGFNGATDSHRELDWTREIRLPLNGDVQGVKGYTILAGFPAEDFDPDTRWIPAVSLLEPANAYSLKPR